ncbi:uncharacterized protein par-1 isoform X21 [Drosophila tropicalis]|uniref:uncharacterized protein par-1 isoform X21 n=1 Tax=Drosophila tropicalis TaxID=46794 RepID=UPI0035ABBD1C
MGQTSSHRQTTHSSSHNNNNKDESNSGATSQFGNRRSSTRKSKSSKHYSTLVQPLGKDEISILRDSLLRNGSIMRKNMGDPQLRPVTISELKPQTTKLQTTIAASIGENSGAPGDVDVESASVCGIGSSSTNNLMSFQLPVDRSAKTEDLAAESSAAAAAVAPAVAKEKRNEFYIVGDGYHRTDHCYYRGPNGDFHKLPSDSFHKMSEGCFVRMADGVFRRLEIPSKSQISRRSSRADDMNGGGTEASGNAANAATNVKSQLMKFLKRSKSHTPATIAKLQKDKEEARLERKQRLSNAMRHQKAMALANTPATAATTTTAAVTSGKQGNQSSTTGGTGPSIRNNKIVVTMIENGGLPIVATSKAERPKPPTSSSGSEKARTSRIFCLHAIFRLKTHSACPPTF